MLPSKIQIKELMLNTTLLFKRGYTGRRPMYVRRRAFHTDFLLLA